MRIADIQDATLRDWVLSYTEDTLREAKAKKTSPAAFHDLWRSYLELDWHALRTLIPLRKEAATRFLPDEIEMAIQKHLAARQHAWKGPQAYSHPYSLGAEVFALRALLQGLPPGENHVEVLL